MAARFQQDELINGRYRLKRILGQGALGQTMLAKDEQTNRDVAIKELLPSRMKRWKDYDLFHRECQTLRSLSHEGIPTYYHDFEIESESEDEPSRLFLVQQFVDGKSLQDELDDAGDEIVFTEERVRQIMMEVLDVLHYLHTLNPPVIHRDLKPANIMQTSSKKIVVIDFGAVREAVTADGVGSTIVGTMGYMPPEQYAGSATPATDLFALGATAVQLVSGKSPTELFEGIHEFKIPKDLPVTLGFERVLLKLTEPDVERRYQSAAEVIEDLDRRFLMVPKEAITGDLPIPYEIRPAPRPFPGFQFRDPGHGFSHTGVVMSAVFAWLLSFAFPVTALLGQNWAFAPALFVPFIATVFVLYLTKNARLKIALYRRGDYTLGEITGRFRSSSTDTTVNLTYRYWVGTQFRYGAMSTSDELFSELATGDPLGIIFDAQKTSDHVVYAVPAAYAQKQSTHGQRLLETDN